MPKPTFLLASCLQNGITCSLLQRLINPCGKLVFHNAECLEQSVREWAISSFRDSLGWPAVNGIAGEILLQSCLVRNSSRSLSGFNQPATMTGKSVSGGLNGNGVGEKFAKDLFSLLCAQETIPGFCVRFRLLFLCCVAEQSARGWVQGCLLTWIYGSAQRRGKTPQLLLTHV